MTWSKAIRKVVDIRWRPWAMGVTMVAAVAFATPAEAFRLSPISTDFDPSGRGAVKNFELFNETAESVPIEVTVVRRTANIDGKETLTPENNDFVVYPPLVTLKPGTSQVVQVRWIGNPAPEKELAFRIIAEQLPVEMDRTRAPGAAIRLLVRYEGSLYIMPKNVKPDVRLESLKRVTSADGKAKIELILENHGNAHGIVRSSSLTVTDVSGKSTVLATDVMEDVNNTNILVGAKRRYLLEWADGLADGVLEGTFKANTER